MQAAVAEVTLRGQVTIPKSVRDKYHLIHGAEVELMDLGGSIMIIPRETSETINRMHANFDAMREELISADVTLEDMMSALRKIRESDSEIDRRT